MKLDMTSGICEDINNLVFFVSENCDLMFKCMAISKADDQHTTRKNDTYAYIYNLQMCTYIYMFIYVDMYIYMYIYANIFKYLHTHANVNLYVYI